MKLNRCIYYSFYTIHKKKTRRYHISKVLLLSFLGSELKVILTKTWSFLTGTTKACTYYPSVLLFVYKWLFVLPLPI